jgi:hypothetical protein
MICVSRRRPLTAQGVDILGLFPFAIKSRKPHLVKGKIKMNWKFMTAVTLGLLLGLLVAPFEHKAVSASAAPANAHFQMQDATVDESNGQGQDVPTHEVFLLDTQSGQVWKFQGLFWGRDKDGATKVFRQPTFLTVTVESPK